MIDVSYVDKTFGLPNNVLKKFEKYSLDFRRTFVIEHIGDELQVAKKWIRNFKRAVSEAKKVLGFRDELYPKEFKSFLDDPEIHLTKKIFFYTIDLLRGILSLEDFLKSAAPAVKTSLKTNMRSVYQYWVYVNILNEFGKRGGEMVYPEVKYLMIGRTGKQKTGWIPPNSIMHFGNDSYLSFFLEAPRPIAWGDTGDLKRIWKLYTALRPDMLVYTSKVLNIVNLDGDLPILRPDVILECKELSDWYKRKRDMRGYLARPLSVEEWRNVWIKGLWGGLAEAMGIEESELVNKVKKKKSILVKDIQVVSLYNSMYKPKKMFLISRSTIPRDIRNDLEERGIIVYDNIGFRKNKLRIVVDELENLAKKSNEKRGNSRKDFIRKISKFAQLLDMDQEELLDWLIRYIETNFDHFSKFVKDR